MTVLAIVVCLFTSFITINESFCTQGIKGKVVWLSGNQMPGPDRPQSRPTGIKREIYIYEPTTLQQVTQQGNFYSEIKTALVKKVVSKKDGSFKVRLPLGEYSVFVKEEGGFFANLFDDKGRINIVEVNRGQFTEMTIRVDYKAAY